MFKNVLQKTAIKIALGRLPCTVKQSNRKEKRGVILATTDMHRSVEVSSCIVAVITLTP